jgi:hypothetical protein
MAICDRTEPAVAPPDQGALPAPRRAGRRLWRSVLILSAAGLSASVLLVSAIFTDSDTVGANTFVTGTVNLGTSPTTAVVHMSPMAPGDVFTGAMTVTNNGTLALRYSATSTTTENVAASLITLAVRAWATDPDNGGDDCDSTDFATFGTSVRSAAALGNTSPVFLFGDADPGDDSAGERVLAAGASEVLCFQAALPLNTTSGAAKANEGVTSTATLTFTSEQTTHN